MSDVEKPAVLIPDFKALVSSGNMDASAGGGAGSFERIIPATRRYGPKPSRRFMSGEISRGSRDGTAEPWMGPEGSSSSIGIRGYIIGLLSIYRALRLLNISIFLLTTCATLNQHRAYFKSPTLVYHTQRPCFYPRTLTQYQGSYSSASVSGIDSSLKKITQ
jgi:hypothetical protein